ncbi:hypothetical protein CANMA_002204 [Candida margitis]|uniref:uncharacterized protein n=1 Tax=Candida margitis TaxID=1775924 RepID=UPI002227288D|nr:uncharacterized protein CANMA_002204 [Candida margitis]KAI5968768.1 hypothetical protein CANMA_002204 [Candida margitis]
MSQFLFANVSSYVSTETMANYAKFEDNLKCNTLVRQLYSIEYVMKSIDQVLLDEEVEEEEDGHFEEQEYEDDSSIEAAESKHEKEEDGVSIYQFDVGSCLHYSNPSISHIAANDYLSLITEPRFRISQSVSDRIRNRNLSLLRVNTI